MRRNFVYYFAANIFLTRSHESMKIGPTGHFTLSAGQFETQSPILAAVKNLWLFIVIDPNNKYKLAPLLHLFHFREVPEIILFRQH